MGKKRDKFCIVPFLQLSTRSNGFVKVCSQINQVNGIAKNSTLSELENKDYSLPSSERLNLNEHSIDTIWNSKFMKDFRMKKINNEFMECCERCYYDEEVGAGSKRQDLLRRYSHLVDEFIVEAQDNEGELNRGPLWWELRLSSNCQLSCRMCIPQSSSRIRKEYFKNRDSLSEKEKENVTFAQNMFEKYGELSDSDLFMSELEKHKEFIEVLELHGGEPLIDKKLFFFLEKLIQTGHSKKIHIHLHSNILELSEYHIQILNSFKSGELAVSIDAYKEENEYCRYPSKWNKIDSALRRCVNFNNNWVLKIYSAIGAYQSLTIHRLLQYIDNLVREINLNIYWEYCVIKHPGWQQVEIIPLKMRLEALTHLESFLENSFVCNEYVKSDKYIENINKYIASLKSEYEVSDIQRKEFKQMTMLLDKIRNQKMEVVFPHLKEIF